MSVRLLIADDHAVIRAGLAMLLAGTDIEVIAQATTGKECLEQAEHHRPDVVLLDIRMPDGDGLETLQGLRQKAPDAKVIMFSTYDNPTYIARAVALGASDYVLKGSPRQALIDAIAAAAIGQSPSHAGQLQPLARTMSNSQPVGDDRVQLTRRETQVLRHIALGLNNKEIGRSLEISVETVKEHVQHVLRKLAVSDRAQAAIWAVRRGLA